MKPVAPESAPPITNPIAGSTSPWTIQSRIASGIATRPMIWYWRRR